MKTTTKLYWVFTAIFGAIMALSAIPDILMVPHAVTFITALGFPTYIVPFLGAAKLLGIIAIMVPGFPRIKEWAYAGLFFDLAGATYSNICGVGFKMETLMMVIPFALGALSYIYYHKKMKQPVTRFEPSPVAP
jgi:hypothetical protein